MGSELMGPLRRVSQGSLEMEFIDKIRSTGRKEVKDVGYTISDLVSIGQFVGLPGEWVFRCQVL